MGTLNCHDTEVLVGTLVAFSNGLNSKIVGVVVLHVWMVIPFATVRVCVPVLICTVLAPRAAPDVVRLAVTLVALLSVTGPNVPAAAPPTEMPGPKFAVVELVQVVNAPVTLTARED